MRWRTARYGNVDVAKGVLIGVPAAVGVVAGTALQQRVPERAVSGCFARAPADLGRWCLVV